MDETIIAAIIAATIAALTSIANIILTIHRNKQDGITAYRMQWIHDVRNEFTNILSWNFYRDKEGELALCPIDELKKSVYKASLLLNVKDEYDQSVLDAAFKFLGCAQKVYESLTLGNAMADDASKIVFAMQSNAAYQKVEKIRKELHKLIRVYLKTEWTRVKVESSIHKFKYFYCWKPFCGFQANKAIEKFLNEYKDWSAKSSADESNIMDLSVSK